MTPTFLFSPQASPASFYALYALFILNEKTAKNPRFERWLWDLIKCELFYIGGACKHSGNCCRTLMIYQNGKPLNSTEKFESARKKNPVYERFIPVLSRAKSIRYYTCSCLKKDNWCSEYATRPSFCRNYPLSSFIQEEKVLAGCGFRVAQKTFRPKIRNKRLSEMVIGVIKKNGIYSG